VTTREQEGLIRRPQMATYRPGGTVAPPSYILVIDDNEAWREGIGESLRLRGHRVDLFDSASRALEFLGAGAQPDTIVLDLCLEKGIPGAEFSRRLRAHPRLKSIPVLAVSGSVRESVPEASWFLPKPVDFEVLLEVLERFAPGAASPQLATDLPS
jgi:CheY-like chemotaxis protein